MKTAEPSFKCTECAECCKNTIIPITADEAADWDAGGGATGMSAQLLLWNDEDALRRMMPADTFEWWRERTSEARCGRVRVRASLRLFTVVSGPCHNLRGTRCGAYERRPLVCRAYPVEVNEPPADTTVYPDATVCPPEAWGGTGGGCGELRASFQAKTAYHEAWKAEQTLLRHVRGLIGTSIGAIPSDAEIVHALPRGQVRALMSEGRARAEAGAAEPSPWWQVATFDTTLGASLRRKGGFVVGKVPAGTLVVPGLSWRTAGKAPKSLYQPPKR